MDLDLVLFDRLRFAGHLLRTTMQESVDPSASEGGADRRRNPRDLVLALLLERGGDVRQKDIARQIRVSPSTLSVMIDRLEEEGYVRRAQSPHDGRVTVLTLTPAGTQRAQQAIAAHKEQFREAFSRLTPQEKESLIHLLDILLGNA